jgi:hypothetical protein
MKNVIQAGIVGLMVSAGTLWADGLPSLVSEPWLKEPHWSETTDEVLITADGKTSGGKDVSVFFWDSFGRVKLSREDSDPNFYVGYRLLGIAFDSEDRRINGDWWDMSLTLAGRVGEVGDGWKVSLAGGAGIATDDHFGNSDALYGLGLLAFGKVLDTNSAIHAGIQYEGNSVLLPAVPLPFVQYRRQASDQFAYTIGFPTVGARWQPMEQLTMEARYDYPLDWRARLDWRVTKPVGLFVEYTHSYDAFAIEDQNNRRMLYELSRVSGGVRWVNRLFDVSLGIGYGFDQEVRRGYDLRSDSRVTKLSDEALVYLKLMGKL